MITLTWRFYSIINDVLGCIEAGIFFFFYSRLKPTILRQSPTSEKKQAARINEICCVALPASHSSYLMLGKNK